jgi:hypothetical protein
MSGMTLTSEGLLNGFVLVVVDILIAILGDDLLPVFVRSCIKELLHSMCNNDNGVDVRG